MEKTESLLAQWDLTEEAVTKQAFYPEEGGSFFLLPDGSCWWSRELLEFLHLPTAYTNFSAYLSRLFPEDLDAFYRSLTRIWKEPEVTVHHRIRNRGDVMHVTLRARQYQHPEKGLCCVGSVVPRQQQRADALRAELDFATGCFWEPDEQLARFFDLPLPQLAQTPLLLLMAPEQRLLFSHWYDRIPSFLIASRASFSLENGDLLRLSASYQSGTGRVRLALWRSSEEQTPEELFVWDTLRREEQFYQDLFSDFSRELREPAQRVLSALEVSQIQIQTALPPTLRQDLEQQLDYARESLEQVTRLNECLADIVTLHQQPQMQYSLVPLMPLVQQVMETARPHASHYGVSLELHSGIRPDRQICCDRKRVAQSLLNLLANSVRSGGNNGRVTLEVQETEGNILFSVSDHRGGVTMAQTEHLFYSGLFANEEENESRWDFQLWRVQILAAMQRGYIKVRTEPEAGRVYTLYLPKNLEAGALPFFRQQATTESLDMEALARAAFFRFFPAG